MSASEAINLSGYLKDNQLTDEISEASSKGQPLFHRLGGRSVIDRAHKIFYDKLFAHPLLKDFFDGIDQKIIEGQQSDFFSQLTGGPKIYSGRMPLDAHMHIFISEEQFELRHSLLASSLQEAGIAENECFEWLKIDKAFKATVVKKSIDDCRKRYYTDKIIAVQAPKLDRVS
jgi:truncated hemoglobin YjbI